MGPEKETPERLRKILEDGDGKGGENSFTGPEIILDTEVMWVVEETFQYLDPY